MNKYLSELGYQGPNILLALILLALFAQQITNPAVYVAVIVWQITSHLLNVVIKNTLKAPRPDSNQDPKFAQLNPAFANYMTIHRNFGMPSGHAQAMLSQLIFIALYFKNPFLTATAAAQTLLTLWQRYETRRHSLIQLLAGSVLGIAVGLAFLYFFKNAYTVADADMITIL